MIHALLLIALSSLGAAPADAEIAERYLSALYSQDLETLATLSHEEMVFRDDTATFLGNGAWRYEGRKAVVEFFAASLETVSSARFEKVRSFTSGEQTVLELDYIAGGDGAAFGAPGVHLEMRVSGVTVITVRDSKVVEHHDFIDYPSMMRQIEEQKAAAAR